MKHSVLFAVSLAALSLAGCKKEAEAPAGAASSGAPSDVGAMAPLPTTAPASAGQAFADAAAASDTFEIESSKLAVAKATSAKVRQFAEQMIKAHTDSTAKLKQAASSASPAIMAVPRLNATQQQTMDTLGTKMGSEFDTAYAAAQVQAHQMTLDTLKGYSSNGDVPSLKAFATELVPVVTAHLNMAKGL